MIVTIDGPSGTGKSSVAKALSKRLGFSFFDTGALYRALAYWMQKEGIEEKEVASHLSGFLLEIKETTLGKQYFVSGEEVTDLIRSKEITAKASKIAAVSEVRQALLPFQRTYAEKCDSVFEGRDLGSVVFPKAEAKIFLSADPWVRAKRRHEEFLEKNPGDKTTVEQFFEVMQARDKQDETREVAPLICPEGAYTLDTTDLTMEQVVDKLEQHVRDKKNQCKAG